MTDLALLSAAARGYIECSEWYRRCLEDIQDGRPVRGLAEAKASYQISLDLLYKEIDEAEAK